jgi:hypothetical protein
MSSPALEGSDSPVLPYNFIVKTTPVGDISSTDMSTLVFVFDLDVTLIDSSKDQVNESAVRFISGILNLCKKGSKRAICLVLSENTSMLAVKEKIEKVEIQVRKNIPGFMFDGFAKRPNDLEKINKTFALVLSLYSSVTHKPLSHPVFFFDDSEDQIDSMQISADKLYEGFIRRGSKYFTSLYLESFHISSDISWSEAMDKIRPFIPLAPRLNLRGSLKTTSELSPMVSPISSPALRLRGGRKSFTKKSRKLNGV